MVEGEYMVFDTQMMAKKLLRAARMGALWCTTFIVMD